MRCKQIEIMTTSQKNAIERITKRVEKLNGNQTVSVQSIHLNSGDSSTLLNTFKAALKAAKAKKN